ncbi:MAG TPA: protein kinase [Blastocatellia bacterium]|nr:protein kinase [Blastocatellia bacterium]
MARLIELPGRTLDGKYHLDKLLGQGGMGAVFLATHLGTKRPVALKVIAPQLMGNEEFIERFRREAEAAGRLRHPNVVNVTDFGFTSSGSVNLAYLVMEYLDGGSLADMLKERDRLPLGFVIDIVEQICLAVSTAHEQGIIHRDLKPDNIWLQPDQRGGYNVKVLDFGLAKLHDAAPSGEADLAEADPAIAATQFANQAETVRAAHNIGATNLQRAEETEVEAATQIQQPVAAQEEQTQLFDNTSANATDLEAATQLQPPSRPDNERTNRLAHNSTPIAIDLSHGSASNLTRVGAVMGTPLYMSPEQCRGDLLDMKSDIYSLGVIVYQMLAGAPPFSGDMSELIIKHTNERPASLIEKRNDIPKSVSELVMSALAKDPARRPANAALFAKALRAAAESDLHIIQEGRSYFYNHVPGFMLLSAIIYLPFAIPSVMYAAKFSQSPNRALGLADALFWLAVFLFIQVANRLNIATSTLAIRELRLSQTGPLPIRSILFNLIKRLPALVLTSLMADLISLVNLLRLVLPGLRSFVNYSLAASVIAAEKKSAFAALGRSKTLAERLPHLTGWATIRSISFVICSILFLPALVAATTIIFGGTTGGGSFREVYPVMIGFGWFLIFSFYTYNALPLVLIYFKARQALGEVLEEASSAVVDQDKVSKRRGLLNRKTVVWIVSPIIMAGLMIYTVRSIEAPRPDTLATVASRGRYKDVRRMLAEGADPNERARNARTPIMSAAGQGQWDVVKALIDAGADVNARDGDGDTALHDTALQGRTELARLLIKSGADVNAANQKGETALILAAKRGFADYVRTLVASGADASVTDNTGKRALDYAEEEERPEVIQILTSAGTAK